MNSSLKPFIQRKVVVLPETASAYEAARAMSDHAVGSVLVSDQEGHISGIVTDRDILIRVLAKGHSQNISLAEISENNIIAADETADLYDILELMEEYSVRRIPIIQKVRHNQDKCIGIVTLDDLIAAEIADVPFLSKIIKAQIRGRHRVYKHLLRDRVGWEESQDFIQKLSHSIGHNIMATEELLRFVLSALAQRLHYTAAVQFISEMPVLFQMDLYDMAGGPERTIDAEFIRNGASNRLHCEVAEADEAVHRVWTKLLNYGNEARLMHVLDQLPSDIQSLLTGKPSEKLDHHEERPLI